MRVQGAPVFIAGAGCAGLAAGLALQRRGVRTVLCERAARVGGLAGGIELGGNVYEYGPHIFHTTDPEVLADVEALCADVLLPFERTIRIKFGGRYFAYPLSPFDVLTKLPPLTVVRACASLGWHAGGRFARRALGRARPFANSEEALRAAYGDVLYRIFFADYIRKVWGLGPAEFSPSFANQRLPRFRPLATARALLARLAPGRAGESTAPAEIRTEGYVENVEGRYFTTRRGFSLICEALAREYVRLGGELRLGADVRRVRLRDGRCVAVEVARDGQAVTEPCEWFVSTVPINRLPDLLDPPPPAAVRAAARALGFRAIVFVGLLVARPTVLPASFLYFRDKSFNRLTDLARFRVEVAPEGATILVAEITCQPGDPPWVDGEAAAARVVDELVADELLAREDVLETHVFRAEHGYPIYRVGYEAHLAAALDGLAQIPNLSTIGRQGRFAYVNTHVALKMGYELARELTPRLGRV